MEEDKKPQENVKEVKKKKSSFDFKKKWIEFKSKIQKVDRKKAAPVVAGIIVGLIVLIGFFAYQLGYLNNRKIATTVNNEVVDTSDLPPEKLTVVQANVTLERDGQSMKMDAGHEEELKEGDKIATDLNGVVVLTYPSGTTVRIGSESVTTFENKNTLKHQAGKVYVRFKKLLGVQENFEVETDNYIAAVRGTAFATIVKQGVDPKILVSEHVVKVTPKDKDGKLLSDQSKEINEGEEGVFNRVNRVLTTKPQKLTDEEKDWLDFNNEADSSVDVHDLLEKFKSLRMRTPTPTPSPSGTPGPTPVPLSSITTMPGVGYTRSSVSTSVGTFTLACYGANKGSVRMLTDSASDSDCVDNCPVMDLQSYAIRNGGVAAMNGMYFCPADYPACAGKVNTFDTLFFNSRTHQYMNSANNVYSNIPFVGMNSDHSMSFVGSSSSWGRDTGIIGGTAGNPRLMAGSNYAINLEALDDKQRNVKSNRGAIVQEGDNIYLCITQGATVPDSARVYETLGADNAINVDGGGSSALWVNGSYKYGPGRQIPTAIILAP